MTDTVDTTDVRKPRPYKINAYVSPDLARYLKMLASDNSRTISAELGLILKAHKESANV